jgi:anaphase-promoting complex subunit 4
MVNYISAHSIIKMTDSRLGQLLAIAWSDGSVRLIGAESSKVVHQFSTGDAVSGVTCVGWSSNLTGKIPGLVSGTKAQGSWESLLLGGDELFGKESQLDLPRNLSLIDIETSLPKLSVLASGIGS